MTLGPILGDERCPHANLAYYHSAYQGNYAVCQKWGGHLWVIAYEGIVVPAGVEVVDLDTCNENEDDDAPQYPTPTKLSLEEWKKGVEDWKT